MSRLCRQAGVEYAVGGLPVIDTASSTAESPWDFMPLLRLQEDYRAAGFELVVIEARPPLNKAKRGLPGRDEEIETVCRLLENMGKLHIPVWCYEWMTDFNWLRTATAVQGRGGSLVSGFDASNLADAPPTELGPIGEDKLWETLEYFLRKVVPVAERAGVRLAMHPDDPPAVADPWGRADHAQRRQLPATARPRTERIQRDHVVPGELHADDRRPALGHPAFRPAEKDLLRSLPGRDRDCRQVRRNMARRRSDRSHRMHEGV